MKVDRWSNRHPGYLPNNCGAGINGDEVDVDLEFDTEPREVAITSGLLQSQKIKVIQ
jgi:hypothetical protein